MLKRIIYLQFFAFLLGLVTNLVHPITPAYLRVLKVDDYFFGLFFAAMNLGIFLAAPFWGNLGNTKTKGILIGIGFLGYGLSQFLFGYFDNQYLILLVRFTAGIFTASFQVLTLTYLLEMPINNKKTQLSIYLAIVVLGGSFGYLIGGLLGDYFDDLKNIFYLQAGFSMILFLLAFFLFENKEDQKQEKRKLFPALKEIKTLPKGLYLLFIVVMIANISFISFARYLDLYLTDLNHLTSTIGVVNFVTGIITIFVSLVVVPFLLRKYQGLKIVVISLMGAGLFSFLTFILPQEGVIYFIFSLFMVYTGFKTVYEPAMIAHLNEQKVINTGALMGLRQSALALGAVLGPAIAGVLYGVINFYLFIILASLLMLASLMLMGYQNKGGAKT